MEFSGWDKETDGTFVNGGENVQFNPDTPRLATICNHLGTYELQQFHFHWGQKTGEGTEHRINGKQEELEIHFVHTKKGEADTTKRDFITVVPVFVKEDKNLKISGPWSILDASEIKEFKSELEVEEFEYDQLLPEDRNYFYYEGSLTTPPCNETVQWFVLKELLSVPGAYLEQLREIEENKAGDLLEFNFRDAQDLGNRVVFKRSSDDDDDDSDDDK